MSRNFNNDELFLVCKNLDVKDIFHLCSTKKQYWKFYMHKNERIWIYKLDVDFINSSDFPKSKNYLKTMTPREKYKLLNYCSKK